MQRGLGARSAVHRTVQGREELRKAAEDEDAAGAGEEGTEDGSAGARRAEGGRSPMKRAVRMGRSEGVEVS